MKTFTKIAVELSKREYTLRSGGAEGADKSFEKGAKEKEIFIPWKGFENSTSSLVGASAKAIKIASKIHPAWDKCSKWAKVMHGRNIYQVLGLDLKSPSEFVICWTPKGEIKGGTATAIKLALEHNIPVYNFGDEDNIKEFNQKVMEINIEANEYDYTF